MTETDPAPPATLLLTYILAEHPDAPLTRDGLQRELEAVTNGRLHDSTLHDALHRLREDGTVELAGTNPQTYRIRFDN